VIARADREPQTVKLVDTVRGLLKKTRPLHFRKLAHGQKVAYVQRIANADLRTASILIHKPSLNEPEIFREGYRLYFYASRFLLERVSWYCRDNPASGDGTALVIFSNRSNMSYDELRDYLEILQDKTGVTIDWNLT
jgi:hypothetical protein